MTTEAWIKDILSNDEFSTDEELIEFFKTEGKLSQAEAESWVAKRDFYANNIIMNNGSIYKPSL